MKEEQNLQIVNELVDKATTGKHSDKETIFNHDELLVATWLKRDLIKIVKCFDNARKIAFKEYKKNIFINTDLATEALQSVAIFIKCIDYYTDEVNLTAQAIAEYNSYRFSTLKTFMTDLLGEDRMDLTRPEQKDSTDASDSDEDFEEIFPEFKKD